MYSLFITFRKSERETENKEREDADTGLAEDCYIDHFLTHVVIPYLEPYVFTSWTIGFSTGFPLGGHLAPAPFGHSESALRKLVAARPTD